MIFGYHYISAIHITNVMNDTTKCYICNGLVNDVLRIQLFHYKVLFEKKSCLNHHIRHSFRTRHMTVVFCINLRPRQNGRHFADDIYKCIFRNETVWISIKISLKFVPWGLINNTPPLVQMMAWRRTGDKPSFEPMMAQCTDAYMNHPASMS